MDEVQCFEGDGAIPPEISALLRENERLKARLEESQAQHDQDQKYIMELTARVSLMQDKLYQIGQILEIREVPEYEYNKPMMQEPTNEVRTSMADEAFSKLLGRHA